jgi:N-acetylneuraminic acid mutarotase
MAVARHGHAASVVKGMIYIVGGVFGSDLPCGHEVLERFDPISGIWERLPDILGQRISPSVTIMAGMLYVVGGYHEGSAGNDSAERFNPSENTWETLPRMASQRCMHSACMLIETL